MKHRMKFGMKLKRRPCMEEKGKVEINYLNIDRGHLFKDSS